jgi:hypothetical protein
MNVRERLLRRNVRRIHAIANQVVGRYIKAGAENAAPNHTRSNVNHVIGQASPIGEARRIAGD